MSATAAEVKSEGLTRVITVKVPAGELQQRLDDKINEVRPNLQLKGFRPGKVPAGHIKRVYGKALMSEVVETAVQDESQKALADLKPAGQPKMDMKSDIASVVEQGADLEFNMEVEVMPAFEPVDPATLSVERPVANISEDEVNEAIEKFAENNKTYEEKKGAAKDGDAVVCDFVGKIDGEAFEGGTAEDQTIVIGGGQLIPGFEEQLTGAKAGDAVTVNVTFPDEYPAENLKGKDAVFAVDVKEIRAPKTPEVNEDFAKGLGLESLDALKEAMRSQIENEYGQASRAKAKRKLLDALDEKHDFDLPPGMVDAEFQGIWTQVEQEKAAGNLPDEDKDKSEDDLKAEYRQIAERRVRLGLVLAEIGNQNNIVVRDEEVSRALGQEASRFPGQEQKVIEFYQKNPNALAQLRAPIYEEKVVDFILEIADVTDVTVSKEELLREDDEEPVAEEKPAKKPAAKKKAPAKKAAAGKSTAKKPAAKKPAAKKKTEDAGDADG